MSKNKAARTWTKYKINARKLTSFDVLGSNNTSFLREKNDKSAVFFIYLLVQSHAIVGQISLDFLQKVLEKETYEEKNKR